MVRLRNAAMAVALGSGVMGCASSKSQSQSLFARTSIWHCDECDDFPTPAYGPGYSMAPGSYTRPPAQESLESKPPATGAADSGDVSSPPQLPASTPPPTTETPPPTPGAPPGRGADARQPASGGTGLLNT
jgi:hypothetical protein